VIAFASGWFCDRFGSKIISLTCVIISIPAFIWIGVPNQNIQSIVSALAIGGFTFAGTSVSVLLVATKVLQKIINSGGSAVSDSINHHHLKSAPIIFAVIGSTCGIGYFMGSFLAKFNKSIGFFWLCFIFAMLLATLIPVVAYYSKKSNSKRNGGLGQSTSKKSIINNTRPESFAESIMMSDDDDDTTVGSASAKSICCDEKEGKSSIIVVP
jgi:MFS family permease